MQVHKNLLNLVIFLSLIFISSKSNATIHTITIGNNFFTPLGTTITHGDTVRWIWVGGIPHSTLADPTSPKFWDSGIISAGGFSFDVVFTAGDGPGPFPYHCGVHALTMKDTIFIAAADTDGDGVPDASDNCPTTFNPSQDDTNTNGIGDACENCCVGLRGNVDNDMLDITDISDLVYLVDFMFTGGPPPLCSQEANVDGDLGEITDISDLVYLVDFMFTGGPTLPLCP